MRLLAVVTGAAVLGLLLASGAAAAAPEYGIESFELAPTRNQAGAHADYVTEFALNTDESGKPVATSSKISFSLPPGITANLAGFPKCLSGRLVETVAGGAPADEDPCPIDSQVGVTTVVIADLFAGALETRIEPIYNVTTPGDSMVARLGFIAGVMPTFIDVRLDPSRGYGLTASLSGLSSAKSVLSGEAELWGDPADPVHDGFRITPYESWFCNGSPCKSPGGEPRHSSLEGVAFMTNPTRCGPEGTAEMTAASYPAPGSPVSAAFEMPSLFGCELLDFSPGISLHPVANEADSPTGLDAELTLPQEGLGDASLNAEAHLRKVVTKLPEGLVLNSAAAAGLGACSEAQIGLVSESPIRFDAADATCPETSKVGTAEIVTPVLPKPIEGSLYLAPPDDNPFETLLSGYLVAKGQGATVKVAARFDADPATGRLTATFDENPQQPFDTVTLHFKGGPHGVLTTAPACGDYSLDSDLSSWGAADPANPSPSEIVHRSSAYAVTTGPGGGPCPSGAFAPRLEAGSANPVAGGYSPIGLRISRDDGTQRLAGVTIVNPLGLSGKLAGIPYCPDAAIAAVAARGGLGQGAGELVAPSCPAASRVGSVSAGAGSGPSPFYVNTGAVYLAGPYKGAPLSLAIVTPAVTGPFDLGNVVVRVALYVNRETAQITAVSDPLPAILHGIPLDLKDVRVALDRQGFTLNPTSCAESAFAGSAISERGVSAPLGQRFQVGGCRGLDFAPRMVLKLSGGSNRRGHPRLQAIMRPRAGDANLRRVVVTLPKAEILDQGHIGTICTRVQFAANACPAKSVYGHAVAKTPLLSQPLSGPVYLRASSHKLPDLVLDLRGQIGVVAVGAIDTPRNGGLRTTFSTTPDAPLSEVVLTMSGGKKGLLYNTRSLCGKPEHARAVLKAQNGRVARLRPRLKAACKRKHAKRKHKRHHRPRGG